MFTGGKSVLACASVLLALAAGTSGHAIPNPALGVADPTRNDVQRPSTQSPCGSVNIAQNIDSSTAVPANADGTVTFNVENFNAGTDGATALKTVLVDATATGNSFVAGTITANGNPDPKSVETDKVTIALPAGTTCTGGKTKNLCLVSATTDAGFGACFVVSQAGGAAATGGAAAAATGTNSTSTAAAGSTATNGTTATTGTTGTTGTTSTTGTTATTGKKAAAKAAKGKGKGKGKGKKAAAAKAAAAKAAAAKAAAAKAAAAGGAAAAGAAGAAPAPAANIVKPHQKAGTRAARALRRELMEAMMERRGA